MALRKDEAHHTLTTSVAHSSQNKSSTVCIAGRNMFETSNVQNELQNKASAHTKLYWEFIHWKDSQSQAPRHSDRNRGGKLLTASRSFTILRTSDEPVKMGPGQLSRICICHMTLRQQGCVRNIPRAVNFPCYHIKAWLALEGCENSLHPWAPKQ